VKCEDALNIIYIEPMNLYRAALKEDYVSQNDSGE
jgi:hypothetical protein